MADRTSKAVALPHFSDDERRAHLRKAADLRLRRAQIKKDFSENKISFMDLIEISQEEKRTGVDQVCAKIRVSEVIRSKRGIGRAKCAHIMDDLGIAPTRCLGGLGHRQIEHLNEIL